MFYYLINWIKYKKWIKNRETRKWATIGQPMKGADQTPTGKGGLAAHVGRPTPNPNPRGRWRLRGWRKVAPPPLPSPYIYKGAPPPHSPPWILPSLPLSPSRVATIRILGEISPPYAHHRATGILVQIFFFCCFVGLDSGDVYTSYLCRTADVRHMERFDACTSTWSWNWRRCTSSPTTFIQDVTLSVFKGMNIESLRYFIYA
jgi:hypothetical protein